jgi:hypothetical protein
MLGKPGAPVLIIQRHAEREAGFQATRQHSQLRFRHRLIGRQAQRDLRSAGETAFGATQIALQPFFDAGMADVSDDLAQRRRRLRRRKGFDGVSERQGDGLRRRRLRGRGRKAHLAKQLAQHSRQPSFVAVERHAGEPGDDGGFRKREGLVRGIGQFESVDLENALRGLSQAGLGEGGVGWAIRQTIEAVRRRRGGCENIRRGEVGEQEVRRQIKGGSRAQFFDEERRMSQVGREQLENSRFARRIDQPGQRERPGRPSCW